MTKTYCDSEQTDDTVDKTQQAGRDKFHISMCVEGIEWFTSCFGVFHRLMFMCECMCVWNKGNDWGKCNRWNGRKTSDVHNKVGTRGNSTFLQDKN